MQIPGQSQANNLDLGDVTFVKRIHIGNINPNSPINETQMEDQMLLLNKCLEAKGRIIGKDIATGVFQLGGDHQLSLQRVTYHVGFRRKPHWLVS